MTTPDLKTRVGNLTLKNPVLLASGCCGYGQEFAGLSDLSRLGGISTKGLSWATRTGNPMPRTAETTGGMLNAIGLENVGVDRFETEKMPYLRDTGITTVANFFGFTVDEYARLAARLDKIPGLTALEMNISCPNVEKGGKSFGQDRGAIVEITRAVREVTTLPLWVKLAPNVTDICEMARAAQDGGADAVSVINTLVGMKIDIETRRPMIAFNTGGLSGPAIRPIAVAMTRRVVNEVGIPVVGIGGIRTAEDALEFLIAGARAIQVGTWLFSNPRAGEDVLDGIAAHLTRWGVSSLDEIIGTLQERVQPSSHKPAPTAAATPPSTNPHSAETATACSNRVES